MTGRWTPHPAPPATWCTESSHMVRAKRPPGSRRWWQVVAWHHSLGNTGGYASRPSEAKHEATVSPRTGNVPLLHARISEVLVSV